jgi:hypothetical protein
MFRQVIPSTLVAVLLAGLAGTPAEAKDPWKRYYKQQEKQAKAYEKSERKQARRWAKFERKQLREWERYERRAYQHGW